MFGVGVVARCKEDGTGFVRREVLYPGHRHVADRFDKPCANRHLSDHLTRCAPFQRGPRSSDSRQADIGFLIHMRVSRIDQNSATPIDAFQRFAHVHPMYSENNDVALGRLFLGPRDGAGTKISDKISQCLRTSGIRYNYGVTRVYQVTAKRACYVPGSQKTYFHNLPPTDFATFIGVTVCKIRLHADTAW